MASTLRGPMRLPSTAAVIQPDLQGVTFLIKRAVIPAFHHKTRLRPIQEGRTGDGLGDLESIGGGFLGWSCSIRHVVPRAPWVGQDRPAPCRKNPEDLV
ncbi:hypothetical protein [Marichromatium sp. AB31]|uniref:hypothetical protein n=1 Tax=Marichromatium sp. AB31 TaxID=2483362 RepID=UPI0011CDDFEC|nr:hypothetical protein [Marichromatium sp. AB31]